MWLLALQQLGMLATTGGEEPVTRVALRLAVHADEVSWGDSAAVKPVQRHSHMCVFCILVQGTAGLLGVIFRTSPCVTSQDRL